MSQPPDAGLAEGREDVDGHTEEPAEGVEPLVEFSVPRQLGEVVAGLLEEVHAHDPDVVEDRAQGAPQEFEDVFGTLEQCILHGDQHADEHEGDDELEDEAEEPGDELLHGELRVG